MAAQGGERGEQQERVRTLRKLQRHSNGLTTRWGVAGLRIQCAGELKKEMARIRDIRGGEMGECQQHAVLQVPLGSVYLCDAQGRGQPLKVYGKIAKMASTSPVRSVMRITWTEEGVVEFSPVTGVLPMESGAAHLFRELSLIVLANYPELAWRWREEHLLQVQHELDGCHHVFEVGQDSGRTIRHTRATESRSIAWRQEGWSLHKAVAGALDVEEDKVAIVPHPWIHRLTPVWVGKRRWKMTRKKYKTLMKKSQERTALQTWHKVQRNWRESNANIARALEDLNWPRLHKLEGVTAYQTQNLMKLKMGRLRLWTNAELGYRCPRGGCNERTSGSLAHLVWECPDAGALWEVVRRHWHANDADGRVDTGAREGMVQDVFSCSLLEEPCWIKHWRIHNEVEVSGGEATAIAEEMWALCCATTITMIWRWKVEELHQEAAERRTLEDAQGGLYSAIREAFARYRMGCYPLTPHTYRKLQVAEVVSRRWSRDGYEASGEVQDRGTDGRVPESSTT
jgi:hypothetical protein